jgi:dUTPase
VIILRKNFGKYGIQVNPAPKLTKELVCCDLSVGKLYREPGRGEPYDLVEHDLKAGECIVVQTREEFTVPDGVFGILCSKGSLTQRGAMVPNTKVDPMFGGPLHVSVYNASRRTLTIKQGMPFCSIVFYRLEEHTNTKEHRRAPDLSGTRMGFFAGLWERHGEAVIAGLITFLITVIAAAAVTYVQIEAAAKVVK